MVMFTEHFFRTPSADILKELSDSQYTVYDVLPSFFNHHDPLVVLGMSSEQLLRCIKLIIVEAAFEVYVRRAYRAYTLLSIDYEEGVLKLRYQRVFAANCSVPAGGESCSDALVRDTGVSAGSLSICSQGYRAAREAMAKAHCSAQGTHLRGCFEEELNRLDEQRWGETPTVIVYEAEATIKSGTLVTTPRSDALACHPSD